MIELTPSQKTGLAHVLGARDSQLRDEIRAALLESGNSTYIDLAGSVHDLGDEAVADELIELDNALIERHLRELRETADARRRLADGTINCCIDCGGEIGYERLLAKPSAVRCIECQGRYEKTHAHEATPRM